MISTITLLGQFRGDGDGMHDGRPVVACLLLIAAGALVVYGILQLRKGSVATATPAAAVPVASAAAPGSSARTILDERFARGEIDSTMYLHQVETLRAADGYPTAPVHAAPADAPSTDAPAAEAPAADGDPTEETAI